MPVYEFICKSCKKKFEIVKRITDYGKGKVKCPKCKGSKVERRWSSVFAVTSKKS